MINIGEVVETNRMIEKDKLDVRTITLGISLLDCVRGTLKDTCSKIYDKIVSLARNLVPVGEDIEREFGIPIVNKRISVTPISVIGEAVCKNTDDFIELAKTLDRAANEVGVNFIGGYSAIVDRLMSESARLLIHSIPEALAVTEKVCSSVNVGSTLYGINMDAVALMGENIKKTA